MPAHDFANFRILIVPGLHGSGEGHWQTRWERLHPAFERVEQAQWDVPDLEAWSQRLCSLLRASPRPTIIVAHSFGCLTTINSHTTENGHVVGALLVAPADPAKFGVEADLRNARLTYPSIMIASTNDPWMDAVRAAEWAERWGSEFVDAGPLGHINADSELGDWQFGLSQLTRVIYALEYGQTECYGSHNTLMTR